MYNYGEVGSRSRATIEIIFEYRDNRKMRVSPHRTAPCTCVRACVRYSAVRFRQFRAMPIAPRERCNETAMRMCRSADARGKCKYVKARPEFSYSRCPPQHSPRHPPPPTSLPCSSRLLLDATAPSRFPNRPLHHQPLDCVRVHLPAPSRKTRICVIRMCV